MEMFNREFEAMPRKEIKALQLERLKKTVSKVYENNPVYRKKFDAAGVKPSMIKSPDDITCLPFTVKEDFRDNFPYGLFTAPMSDIVRIHASSGTTGKPIVVGYTKGDLDIWSDCVARFLVSCGGTKDDIVQISFGYGLFTGALGLHYGWEKIGATVIPISSGNTERQIHMMKDLRATALVSTPSYALYLGESLNKCGIKREELALRLGFFGAEASTAEMHNQISDLFGIHTNDNYGLSEIMGPGVSGECFYKCGMHIAEDHFYPEILDPDTLKPVREGEWGELVITTITKQGIPVIRYRTKDITRLIYEPCKCGRTHARMEKIKGRTDDMLIIKGVNVFPSQIESVLLEMPDVGNHYEITVTRQNHMDEIEILVEVVDGSLLENIRQLEALRCRVANKIRSVLQIDAKIKLVEPLTLKRFEGKAQRVKDLRNK